MTYVASHAGIFELIFADLLLSESLRILRRSGSRPTFKAPVPASSSIGDEFNYGYEI